MSRDSALLSLQHIDDRLDALESERATISTRLEGDEMVAAADAEHENQEQHVDGIGREQRRLDAELSDVSSRIERDEGRLYSGTISSVKEMEGLQHEVQSLKQRRSSLEDEILVLLDDLEAQQATLLELANTRDRERERWARESVELRQRLDAIAAEEADARRERDQLRESIDAPTLSIYDTLRARKGVAVARLRGSTCSACRVQVPDADRRRVLDPGILARCSNCERILVFGS